MAKLFLVFAAFLVLSATPALALQPLGNMPLTGALTAGPLLATNGQLYAMVGSAQGGLRAYNSFSMSQNWEVSFGVDPFEKQVSPANIIVDPLAPYLYAAVDSPSRVVKCSAANGAAVSTGNTEGEALAVGLLNVSGHKIVAGVTDTKAWFFTDTGPLTYCGECPFAPSAIPGDAFFDDASDTVFLLFPDQNMLQGLHLIWSPNGLLISLLSTMTAPGPYKIVGYTVSEIIVCCSASPVAQRYSCTTLMPTASPMMGLMYLSDATFASGRLLLSSYNSNPAAPDTVGAVRTIDPAFGMGYTQSLGSSYPTNFVVKGTPGQTRVYLLNAGISVPHEETTPNGHVHGWTGMQAGCVWQIDPLSAQITETTPLGGLNAYGAYCSMSNRFFVLDPTPGLISAFLVN